jgi:hypothetical protein
MIVKVAWAAQRNPQGQMNRFLKKIKRKNKMYSKY